MERAFLAGFAGFTSGILCCSFFSLGWWFPAMLALMGVLVLGTACFSKRKTQLLCAVTMLAATLGMVRVISMPSGLPESFVPLLETTTSLEGVVVGEPDIRETTQRVPVQIHIQKEQTTMLAVLPLYPRIARGDRIIVTGKVVSPEPFETDTGRTFRYDRFLAKDGIFALVEHGQAEHIETNIRLEAWGMRLLSSGKRRFQEALAQALPEPGASLASGLLTGGKQGLGSDLLDAFIIAGLVHIVVLSGYNVMIVSEAVLRAFHFLPKHLAALLAGLTIVLFVLMAGAGSASIRAGCMALLALIARATGRTYAVIRALLFVAVLMLLINPLLLAYDPGFQLSFLATLGLILLHPILESGLHFIRFTVLKEVLSSTLAAQIAVLPFLLYQTGVLSLVAVPANILVLPFVPLAMFLAAAAGILSLLVPTLAPLFGLPAHVVLSYIMGVARISADMPLASISIPSFSFWVLILMYGVLGYVLRNALQPEAAGRSRKVEA